jgi:hypothetical protein
VRYIFGADGPIGMAAERQRRRSLSSGRKPSDLEILKKVNFKIHVLFQKYIFA